MGINTISSQFNPDDFELDVNHQPVNKDKFSHGLQVLADEAMSSINEPEKVKLAFERIEKAKWKNIKQQDKKQLKRTKKFQRVWP